MDSVKQVLNWGRENAEKNNVENIRWILEDARKFVKKAIRRGDKFQGIIMDPPAFGLGSKNERWKIENDLQELLQDVVQLLHPKKTLLHSQHVLSQITNAKIGKFIAQNRGVSN